MKEKWAFDDITFYSYEDAADYILEKMERSEYENYISDLLPAVEILGIKLDALEILQNTADIDLDCMFEDWKDSIREDLEQELYRMKDGDHKNLYGFSVDFYELEDYAIPDEQPSLLESVYGKEFVNELRAARAATPDEDLTPQVLRAAEEKRTNVPLPWEPDPRD